MRDKYPMPADAAGIGTASDPETGDVIAIGVVTRRRTYNKTGYICQKDAPAELHACACALLELVQDMPVIKTVLLRPRTSAPASAATKHQPPACSAAPLWPLPPSARPSRACWLSAATLIDDRTPVCTAVRSIF